MEIDEYFAKLSEHFGRNEEMELRELSNQAIEEATMSQNKTLVDISIVSYALGKLMTKPHLFRSEQWQTFKAHILEELGKKTEMGKILTEIIEDISSFDIDLGNYARDVIEKSRIKQASRAYALGISLKQASELTGVDLNELLDYIGATKIHDRPFTKSKNVAERYGAAKKALGG